MLQTTFRSRLSALVVISLAFAVTACFGPDRADQTSVVKDDQTLSTADKLAWMAKTARVLRNGAELDESEVDALLPLSRAEIVDQMLADPRFGDTTLAFNLFFLGFKQDSVASVILAAENQLARTYRSEIFAAPQAISSARAMLENGDYLTLLDYRQPFYMPHIQPATDDDGTQGGAELRSAFLAEMNQAYDQLLAAFSPDGTGSLDTLDRDAGCTYFREGGSANNVIEELIFQAGVPIDYALALVARMHPRISIECSGPTPVADIYARLGRIRDSVALMLGNAESYVPTAYPHTSVLDLRTIPVESLGPDAFGTAYSVAGFWQLLQNSSTNFNRRRGAYVLRTFFCDDLTPLNVVQPDVHAQGAHGSEPSCQACHYKLDPMAGFFRDRGFLGFELPG